MKKKMLVLSSFILVFVLLANMKPCEGLEDENFLKYLGSDLIAINQVLEVLYHNVSYPNRSTESNSNMNVSSVEDVVATLFFAQNAIWQINLENIKIQYLNDLGTAEDLLRLSVVFLQESGRINELNTQYPSFKLDVIICRIMSTAKQAEVAFYLGSAANFSKVDSSSAFFIIIVLISVLSVILLVAILMVILLSPSKKPSPRKYFNQPRNNNSGVYNPYKPQQGHAQNTQNVDNTKLFATPRANLNNEFTQLHKLDRAKGAATHLDLARLQSVYNRVDVAKQDDESFGRPTLKKMEGMSGI